MILHLPYPVSSTRADLVGDMIAEAADMNADLTQQYRTLCGIKRKLLRLKADRNYSLEDVHHYQLMVDAVDSKRVNGIFGGDLQNVPAGQAQCSTILHQDYGKPMSNVTMNAQELGMLLPHTG